MYLIRDLLNKALKLDYDQVKACVPFKQGFLNFNFLVTDQANHQFVCRITKPNCLVNRVQEYQILLDAHYSHYFDYYDLKTGNYVRDYFADEIKGQSSQCYAYLEAIIQEIQRFHQNQPTFDYPHYNYQMYVDFDQNKADVFYNTYKNIVLDLNHQTLIPWTISHNDLNPTNILATKAGVHFIDFEFACLNYDYFDYGYLFKELFIQQADLICLCLQHNWDYQWMLNFTYLTTYISYAWALKMPPSKEIEIYLTGIRARLQYYLMLIKTSKHH